MHLTNIIITIYIHLAAVFCVSCQELTSTLSEGNRTCPGEEVTFTCTTRGSSTLALAWESNEYIGQGDLLQFTQLDRPGMSIASMINENVTATLTKNTDENGTPILESELRIVADLGSVVTCTVANGGTARKEFYIAGTLYLILLCIYRETLKIKIFLQLYLTTDNYTLPFFAKIPEYLPVLIN